MLGWTLTACNAKQGFDTWQADAFHLLSFFFCNPSQRMSMAQFTIAFLVHLFVRCHWVVSGLSPARGQGHTLTLRFTGWMGCMLRRVVELGTRILVLIRTRVSRGRSAWRLGDLPLHTR